MIEEIRSINEVPERIDRNIRMSLVALKNEIVKINITFKVNYFDYAIDYLKDSKDYNDSKRLRL